MPHTPGPWDNVYCDDNEWEINSIAKPDWAAVATVTANKLGARLVTQEEAEANAILIAAAPDLLEALRKWVYAWPLICENPPHHSLREAAHAARAAIAKATA